MNTFPPKTQVVYPLPNPQNPILTSPAPSPPLKDQHTSPTLLYPTLPFSSHTLMPCTYNQTVTPTPPLVGQAITQSDTTKPKHTSLIATTSVGFNASNMFKTGIRLKLGNQPRVSKLGVANTGRSH